MESRAVAKFIRMSPRKVRQVIDLIRGKGLEEALAILEFTPNIAREPIKKLIDSAAANAENNYDMSRDGLWISQAYVDSGPTMKRLRAGSMGRGGIIRKRISHITVVVSDERPARLRGSTASEKRKGGK